MQFKHSHTNITETHPTVAKRKCNALFGKIHAKGYILLVFLKAMYFLLQGGLKASYRCPTPSCFTLARSLSLSLSLNNAFLFVLVGL